MACRRCRRSALIEGNLTRQLAGRIPKSAPSFYFIDLQPDQVARFDAIVHGVPGSSGLDQLPYIASRVTAVNGVPAARVHPTPDTEWALRGGRGLALTVGRGTAGKHPDRRRALVADTV